ncbi:MAG: hypothetical protein ACM3O9_00280 [Methylocystaceae bacterium]
MIDGNQDLDHDVDDDDLDDLELDIEERILHRQGEPLEDEIELWVNRYFQTVTDILNGFFSHVTPAEAVSRMEAISFANLIKEQLEGEPEAVINLAITMINELKNVELEFMRAYC